MDAHKTITVSASLPREWAKLGFRQCSIYHWQMRLHGDHLDYWPTSGKWRWRNKITVGSEAELLEFITKYTSRPKYTD